MASNTKKTTRKPKKSKTSSKASAGWLPTPPFAWKKILAVSLVCAMVGGFFVWRSYAASLPYSRLDCTLKNQQGYTSIPNCLNHSIEATTGRTFLALLGRAPETSAEQYWSNVYNSLPASRQANLVNKLLYTTEARTKFVNLSSHNARVTYLYKTILKRSPDSGGLKYWSGRFNSDKNWGVTITAFLSSSEPISKSQPTTDAVLAALPASYRPAKLSNVSVIPACVITDTCIKKPPVSPRGTYSNWYWNPPASGFSSMEHALTVDSNVPSAYYFWSHQFQFINGDGGYIGLQSNGNRVKDGTTGNTAVFSIFSSGIEATPGVCKVEQSGFDGYNTSGSSCRIAYYWKPGDTYKLKVAKTSSDASGSWWTGYVTSLRSGSVTTIGKIKTPPSWKGMGGWSVMWTENFYNQATTCGAINYSKVRFTKPVANGSTSPGSSTQSYSTSSTCTNSKITPQPAAVIQEVGT